MRHIAVLIFLLLSASLFAQDSNVQRWILVTPPETVSVADVPLVDIEVMQDGHPASHGRPTVQQQVPVRIGLVFDESGSGRFSPSHDASLDQVLDWALDTLQRHKGDAFLVGFNDQIVTSTPITADASQLRLALSQLRPFGGSAIRDAIVHSSEKFNSVRPEPQPVARLLVIVSDGHDNASSAKERDAIECAQRFGVRIYVVGMPPSAGTAGGKSLLEHLASETGGQAFFPTDQIDLDRALAAIGRALSNSFLIGFVPESQDGKAHKLTVQLPKKGTKFAYMPVFYSTVSR